MTDKEKLLEIINDEYIYHQIGEVNLDRLIERLQEEFYKIRDYLNEDYK